MSNNKHNYPIGIIVNRVCLTTNYIVGIERREKMLDVGTRVEIRRTNQNGTMQVRTLNSDGTGLLGWIGSSFHNASKFIERQS